MIRLLIFILLPNSLFCQSIIDSSVFIFNKDRLSAIHYATGDVKLDVIFSKNLLQRELEEKRVLNRENALKTKVLYGEREVIRQYEGHIENDVTKKKEFEIKALFNEHGVLVECVIHIDQRRYNILPMMDSIIKENSLGEFSVATLSRPDTTYRIKVNFLVNTKKINSIRIYRNAEQFGSWLYFDNQMRLSSFVNYYNNRSNGLKAAFQRGKPFLLVTRCNDLNDGVLLQHFKRNNQLSLLRMYIDNIENGPQMRFHKNGRVSSLVYFNAGKPKGKWFVYSKRGSVKKVFDGYD